VLFCLHNPRSFTLAGPPRLGGGVAPPYCWSQGGEYWILIAASSAIRARWSQRHAE
jgi:hypothetical protein